MRIFFLRNVNVNFREDCFGPYVEYAAHLVYSLKCLKFQSSVYIVEMLRSFY